MIAHPAQEWPAIAAEPSSTGSILQGYVFPLAIIAPVFQVAGALIFEHKPPAYACAEAVVLFLLELASLFVVAFIADAFVNTFGGTKDSAASFKWIAYASTARWVAGIFAVIPFFGWLIVLAAPNVAALTERQRLGALVGGFALTAQALFFAPSAAPFLYFRF